MGARKTTLSVLTLVASALFTSVAFAGPIRFYFRGTPSTSSASWAGGSSTMAASADQVALSAPTVGPFPLNDASISFVSGPGETGLGTASDPYMFGPSLPQTVFVTGCLPDEGSNCSPVTLFVGQFQGKEKAYWSGDRGHFIGGDVSGTLNPLLASYLGISVYNFVGELHAVIACSDTSKDVCFAGMSRILAGGDLVLYPGAGGPPPTPEPSALLLLGTGMWGITLVLRRRRTKKAKSLEAAAETLESPAAKPGKTGFRAVGHDSIRAATQPAYRP